jgi:hypothetical protein
MKIVPRIDAGAWPQLAVVTVAGTILAALFGAGFDQVTYALSPAYFVETKFIQFAWADLGWPRRLFVALIGALGAGWCGTIVGWFVARGLPVGIGPSRALRRSARSFGVVACSAVGSAIAGAAVGRAVAPDRFVMVAGAHHGAYLGAFIGLIATLLRRRPR